MMDKHAAHKHVRGMNFAFLQEDLTVDVSYADAIFKAGG